MNVIGLPTSKLDRELPAVAAAFDVVVVDCPPGAGDRAITEAALRVATVAVIPMSHTMSDLDRLRWTLDVATAQGCPAVVVMNRVRAGTRSAREVERRRQRRTLPNPRRTSRPTL